MKLLGARLCAPRQTYTVDDKTKCQVVEIGINEVSLNIYVSFTQKCKY